MCHNTNLIITTCYNATQKSFGIFIYHLIDRMKCTYRSLIVHCAQLTPLVLIAPKGGRENSYRFHLQPKLGCNFSPRSSI